MAAEKITTTLPEGFQKQQVIDDVAIVNGYSETITETEVQLDETVPFADAEARKTVISETGRVTGEVFNYAEGKGPADGDPETVTISSEKDVEKPNPITKEQFALGAISKTFFKLFADVAVRASAMRTQKQLEGLGEPTVA